MNNNLKKIEKELRSFVKRCKDIKYNTALLFSFLVTGSLSLSANGKDDVETAKRGLQTSITDMKKLFKEAKAENDKLMKGSNLELVQLMEQGDHVVKSPWSSWQFGINGFYNNWRGTYKGRGDKKEKYPYEGVFTRSENPYERYTSPDSKNYSLLSTSSNIRSASSNNRQGLKGYGLASTTPVKEPLVGFEVSAGINPRVFAAPTVTPLNATQPNLPTAINFEPPQPTVPVIVPANVNIQVVDLDSYWNSYGDTVLGKNVNVTGTHKTSEGSSLTGGAPTSPAQKKDNAIVEYVQGGATSSYNSAADSVMEE